ncbi:hypothetical protein CF336_g1664 [Tilletia laevis]|uniref:Uncharacterized protein n=1 Tax=Tilletia caries TaxID=13290 RepID=A0A177UCT2_9BASI|nr:hypothetical protein CF336_g1664 [Tilletia laevis]KAE8263738.1 hypothetical protein A4X03_0g1453 [Tilletia caries]
MLSVIGTVKGRNDPTGIYAVLDRCDAISRNCKTTDNHQKLLAFQSCKCQSYIKKRKSNGSCVKGCLLFNPHYEKANCADECSRMRNGGKKCPPMPEGC